MSPLTPWEKRAGTTPLYISDMHRKGEGGGSTECIGDGMDTGGGKDAATLYD